MLIDEGLFKSFPFPFFGRAAGLASGTVTTPPGGAAGLHPVLSPPCPVLVTAYTQRPMLNTTAA